MAKRPYHELPELLYKLLEDEGFFDDTIAIRRDSPRRRPPRARTLRMPPRRKPRRASAANRAYSRCFKKLKPKYMKKNGGWKKNGFARCVRAAHKCARRKR